MSIDPSLLDDLEWRGLIAHSTDLDALREAPTVAAAAARLAPSWDVDPDTLLADLLDLCDGLESRGLIETHVAE